MESMSTSPNTYRFASARIGFPAPRSCRPSARRRHHRQAPPRPGAPQAINFGDAKFMTGRQNIGIIRAEIRGRRDNGQLLDARRLRRNGRHEHRRGIRRRSARNANSHAIKRQIALPQIAPFGQINSHVALQYGRLKSQNVVANPPDRRQKLRAGRPGGPRKFPFTDPNRFASQIRPIDPGGIIEHRRQAFRSHIVANPLDHLLRR